MTCCSVQHLHISIRYPLQVENDRSNYYMSMGYANNNSVTIGEGLERYNVLAKINTKLTGIYIWD